MASSGKTATSHPAASARSRAARMHSTLPSRSPTTLSIWQAATRSRVTLVSLPTGSPPSGGRYSDIGRRAVTVGALLVVLVPVQVFAVAGARSPSLADPYRRVVYGRFGIFLAPLFAPPARTFD